MNIRVALIDNDDETRRELRDYLNEQDEFTVVGEADNGVDGYKLIRRTRTDFLIMDIHSPKLNGFEMLQKLKLEEKPPKIILLTSVKQDSIIERAFHLGTNFLMIKPVTPLAVRRKMEESVIRDEYDRNRNTIPSIVAEKPQMDLAERRTLLEAKVSNVFITVGVPASISGFRFLCDAVMRTVDRPSIINKITKELYPAVADCFATTSSKVERAIRHAIDVAWNKGKIENVNQLFGLRIYSKQEKPTNGELIALVAEKMLHEGA